MENVSVKPASSYRLLYVKEIIFEHTDENHFITVNEIIEMLESSYGISTRRKTIYDDIETLIAIGFDIECVKARQNKYHVLTRDFDLAELRLMIDAVSSLRSLPLCKSKALIEKISRLAGPSADYLIQCDNSELNPKSENKQIFYIIDVIYKAIVAKQRIAFKYYEYYTSSGKALKKSNKEYQVSPYRLVCCNDYYYLIGYSEKHEKVTAFRVDRISCIPDIIKEARMPEPEDLYVDKYIRDSIHMKSGDTKEITLEFSNNVIDAMVDRFGQDLDITFISKTECRAKVTTPINNIFFAWIFGFEGRVRIKAPANIKDDYIRMVSKEMARL